VAARGFTDPVLELVRLLREAADMEHASLLQYTYSAFSLKPGYEAIGGYDSRDTMSLLLIAIEKMKHLGALNRMLKHWGRRHGSRRHPFLSRATATLST
jgi:rubrerythrin